MLRLTQRSWRCTSASACSSSHRIPSSTIIIIPTSASLQLRVLTALHRPLAPIAAIHKHLHPPPASFHSHSSPSILLPPPVLLRSAPAVPSSSSTTTTATTTSMATTTSTSISSTSTQSRSHSGHSHSHHHHHHHHHDNVYLTSTNKSDAGVRITRIGLYVNLAMAISKGIGGYMFHSQALVADAYHALTDMVSDLMTLATVSWSLKPPSSRFPTGYGKVESLGALGVSGLLLCGGIFMGLNASEILYTQFFMDASAAAQHSSWFDHDHGHSHGPVGPDLNAAWLAAGSIIAKEWLYRATMKVAKERKSSVLASNAIHHRIDSLTSIVALATIGGSHVFTDASWLDPVGGLIISLMVIKAGLGNTMSSLLELADVTVDEEIKNSVRRAATKALIGSEDATIAGIPNGDKVEIRDIQGVKSGQNYLMEIELAVPGQWSIEETREIEDAVRTRIGSKVRGVKRVKVQFTTVDSESRDFLSEFIQNDVSARSSPEPEDEAEEREIKENGHNHDDGGLKKRH